MVGKKKSSVNVGTIGAVVSAVRLAYDLAKPATCPTCGHNTYVFVCVSCPRVVLQPRRR